MHVEHTYNIGSRNNLSILAMCDLSLSLSLSVSLKGSSQSKQANEGTKKFLESQARQLVSMLLDGNCLFRYVPHQLVGDAEQHDQLRKLWLLSLLKIKRH